MTAPTTAQLAAAAGALLAAMAAVVAAEALESWAARRRGEGTRQRANVPAAAWPLLGAAAGWLVVGTVGAVLAGVATELGRRWRAAAAQRRRRGQLEREVPALARSIGDGLRGGHSLRAAVAAAAGDHAVGAVMRERLAPIAAGLQRGASLPRVLGDLAAGGGPTLQLLAGTAALHSQTGGRLATELQGLAEAADRTIRAEHDREAATSQARATVRVVAVLPLIAFGGAELLGGGLMAAVLRSPAALALLVAALVLEVGAMLAVRAIVGPDA